MLMIMLILIVMKKVYTADAVTSNYMKWPESATII